jgi:hypothetical protein
VEGAAVAGVNSGVVTTENGLSQFSVAKISNFTSITQGTSKLGQVLPGTRIAVHGKARSLILDPPRRIWEKRENSDEYDDEFGTIWLDFAHGSSDRHLNCVAPHIATVPKGTTIVADYFILLQRSHHKLYIDPACEESWIRIGSGFAERIHPSISKEAPPFEGSLERDFVIF